MLVPRSFNHVAAAAHAKDPLDEKTGLNRRMASDNQRRRSSLNPSTPARTTTASATISSTPPIPVRARERNPSDYSHATAALARSMPEPSPSQSAPHDPKALPPAVAALLAVTQIPRPRPRQFERKRRSSGKRISIDELVSEWKNDEALASASYSSSPGLSILFEDNEAEEDSYPPLKQTPTEEDYTYERSASSESVPSLDADDRSILSNGSPSTPESLRSKRSMSNLKRQTSRSVPATEDCAFNHPLIPTLLEDEDPDEEFIISPPPGRRTNPSKPKSSFTSNLTTSLHALKNAAISSISSFSFNANGPDSTPQRTATSPFSDDVLWSHPFLFPRFSPEIRPATTSTQTTAAQRRYLNPTPLTFEEQEAPYQQALHAPYLAERIEGAPTIQMQTYARGGGGGSKRRGGRAGGAYRGPDPQSEAGRALLGAAGLRPRELRENSDFLRIVVMEMNMKRSGKLETGKARLWLPPRQVGGVVESEGKVPSRWIGQSAY